MTYFSEARTHDSLLKDAPGERPLETRPSPDAGVTKVPRLGGLYHSYTWRRAALTSTSISEFNCSPFIGLQESCAQAARNMATETRSVAAESNVSESAAEIPPDGDLAALSPVLPLLPSRSELGFKVPARRPTRSVRRLFKGVAS